MAARRGPGPVAVLALLALLGPGWPLRGARAVLNLQELSELKYGLEILAEPVLAGQVRRGTGDNGWVGGKRERPADPTGTRAPAMGLPRRVASAAGQECRPGASTRIGSSCPSTGHRPGAVPGPGYRPVLPTGARTGAGGRGREWSTAGGCLQRPGTAVRGGNGTGGTESGSWTLPRLIQGWGQRHRRVPVRAGARGTGPGRCREEPGREPAQPGAHGDGQGLLHTCLAEQLRGASRARGSRCSSWGRASATPCVPVRPRRMWVWRWPRRPCSRFLFRFPEFGRERTPRAQVLPGFWPRDFPAAPRAVGRSCRATPEGLRGAPDPPQLLGAVTELSPPPPCALDCDGAVGGGCAGGSGGWAVPSVPPGGAVGSLKGLWGHWGNLGWLWGPRRSL